ncbi:TetR/AcrR family transcriptional regulator [Mycobacterium sp. URHB0044]|uniref:TetR/AcrR family transcriptional regulator n=1 Tax=Mycobacterium sp. URHB0044 TaxID=1380386 RepID=UPI000561A5FB|nr:TetR/AcrR family transcriptional regulator [Mycobacterium sp. URHB0044]
MNAQPVDHRRLPRRRDGVLIEAIHAATLAELSERGYAGLSIDRVAKRARTSKAAIYRRWPSRAELVAAVIRHASEGDQNMAPDTGDLRDDLFAVLRAAADRLDGPFGEAARGLIAETLADPDSTRAARDHLQSQRNAMITTVLERAVSRGQVTRKVLTPQLISLAPTLVSHHFLLHGAPIADQTIIDILDHVVMPLLQP